MAYNSQLLESMFLILRTDKQTIFSRDSTLREREYIFPNLVEVERSNRILDITLFIQSVRL